MPTSWSVAVSIPAINTMSASTSTMAKCRWIQLILYSNTVFLGIKLCTYVFCAIIIALCSTDLHIINIMIVISNNNRAIPQPMQIMKCKFSSSVTVDSYSNKIYTKHIKVVTYVHQQMTSQFKYIMLKWSLLTFLENLYSSKSQVYYSITFYMRAVLVPKQLSYKMY